MGKHRVDDRERPLALLKRRLGRLREIVDDREGRRSKPRLTLPEALAASQAADVAPIERKHRVDAPKARVSNRATFDGDVLALPAFTLFDGGGHAPWRAPRTATFTDDNGVAFAVERNRTRARWWVSASKAGMRMSNAASTGSPEIGAKWEAAVAAGNVRTAETSR